VHIYVSYAMLKNIFAHVDRISRGTVWGYKLVIKIKWSGENRVTY
jgi:hypothetical protein